MSELERRCSAVWGFGSFAVKCARLEHHAGEHRGRADGKPFVWFEPKKRPA